MSYDALCGLLDEKNMANKDHYKNVIQLSQKLKNQINQLKMKNTSVQLEKSIKFHHHSTHTRDNTMLSPTETLMTYYEEKPLPPIQPSSELYTYKSFDSAVQLIPPVPPKKLHITHTRKKYPTLFHHLQGIYQLDHYIIYKSIISPYMYASRDKLTGENKMTLKLIINMTTPPNELTIEFPNTMKKKKRKKDYEILLNDHQVLKQLHSFISQQSMLPLLVHANRIFCDGYKLYVIYNKSTNHIH